MKAKTKYLLSSIIIIASLLISLPSYALTASIHAPDEAIVGQEVSFEVKVPCNYEIIEVDWLFGDEKKGSGATTSHKYEVLGKLTVTVSGKAETTVEGPDGQPKTEIEPFSAATQITIKAKLKILADSSTLCRDKDNTPSTIITIEVTDAKGNTISSV